VKGVDGDYEVPSGIEVENNNCSKIDALHSNSPLIELNIGLYKKSQRGSIEGLDEIKYI
jgi:hypothetical protein